MPTLFAIGDLHVNHVENREFVVALRPESEADRPIACGDIADSIWVPGNPPWEGGVRFEKVSLGYQRGWIGRTRGAGPGSRRILGEVEVGAR